MIHGTTDLNYPIEGGAGSGELGVPEIFYPVVHSSAPNTLADWRRLKGASGPAACASRATKPMRPRTTSMPRP